MHMYGWLQPIDLDKEAETLARKFHDLYEKHASEFGYETREDTRVFDPTTPNGKLTIKVIKQLALNGEIIFVCKR